MFFNTHSNDQDRTSATYAAIQEVLAPLQQIVPELYAELISACDSRYSPQRLGEIFRMYVTTVQERLEQVYERREEKLRRRFDEELRIQKDLLKKQENQIRELKDSIYRMALVRDEATQKLLSQNSLIASLHQQIRNLNDGSSADK